MTTGPGPANFAAVTNDPYARKESWVRAGRLRCHVASSRLDVVHVRWAPSRSARACALLAGAAALGGATSLVALHVLPASSGLDPVSEPLSAYVFTPDGWLFDLAVAALALGLALLVSALVRGRCLGSRSPASALLAGCSLTLVLVAVFPEHESNGAVGTAGRIHWIAAMLVFGGLTVAPSLLGQHRTSVCLRLTWLARRLSICIGPCFLVVLAAGLVHYESPLPVPAWTFDLGERLLVALELALSGVLAAWAWFGCACRVDQLAPGDHPELESQDHSVQRIREHRGAASVGQLPVSAAGDEGAAESPTGLVA